MPGCAVALGGGEGPEVRGRVSVTYAGRYDGVSINAQVTGSNSLVSFESCNGRPAGGAKSRLFVPSGEMPGGTAEFVARVEPPVKGPHEIRVRASIIEQHKEVESDTVFESRP